MDKTESSPDRVNWRSVILYYFLACAISWPFFWWRDMEEQSWAAWEAPSLIKTLTYMGGPAVAAVICLLLFRPTHERTITLAGSSAVRSLAFYLIPIMALCVAYYPEIASGNTSKLLINLVIGAFVVTVGEELGWRGFLQDALRRLPKMTRYALIGVMWELWHFTNRTHEGPLAGAIIRVLIFMMVLSILSWIIGEAVERSKSVTVAVSLHVWVNILVSVGLLFEASPTRGYAVFAASIVLWIYLLRSWPNSERTVAHPAEYEPPQRPAKSMRADA